MAQKTWVIPVDDEGGISFPEDLMKVMEWEDGTVLEWDINDDGSIKLKSAYANQESCPSNPQQLNET